MQLPWLREGGGGGLGCSVVAGVGPGDLLGVQWLAKCPSECLIISVVSPLRAGGGGLTPQGDLRCCFGVRARGFKPPAQLQGGGTLTSPYLLLYFRAFYYILVEASGLTGDRKCCDRARESWGGGAVCLLSALLFYHGT